MRYAIISDIHGNIEALMEVLDFLKNNESIDLFLCCGDIVGYGANPTECIKVIQDIKAESVLGNHDCAVIGKLTTSRFNPIAREAITWSISNINEQGKAYINTLPYVYRNDDLIMVHGSLNNFKEFYYLMYVSDAIETFLAMDRNICFVGHSHIPVIFKKYKDDIEICNEALIKLDSDCKYIVNTGSVGQPRDGDPRAAFCIFDSEENVVEIKRIKYNIQETQKKIIQSGLPEQLSIRLSIGR